MFTFKFKGLTCCSVLDKYEFIRGFSLWRPNGGSSLFLCIHYRVNDQYALEYELYYRNRITAIRLWGNYGLPVEDYAERGEKVYCFEKLRSLWQAITTKKA
jgi:hypothetical protein